MPLRHALISCGLLMKDIMGLFPFFIIPSLVKVSTKHSFEKQLKSFIKEKNPVQHEALKNSQKRYQISIHCILENG